MKNSWECVDKIQGVQLLARTYTYPKTLTHTRTHIHKNTAACNNPPKIYAMVSLKKSCLAVFIMLICVPWLIQHGFRSFGDPLNRYPVLRSREEALQRILPLKSILARTLQPFENAHCTSQCCTQKKFGLLPLSKVVKTIAPY